MTKKIGKEIKFNFHPKEWEQKNHFVEKEDSEGRKRRYLYGVSSGLRVDAHGERMSEKCIKSFQNQASSGQVLLFPDIHGIRDSEDIGFLSKSDILPDGDWYTEYGLWDEGDGIGTVKAEKINTLWKQICGLPPYNKPRQKGFSIEGIIPEESIIYNSFGEQERSVMDDILLDGVVLVPRPAYKDSIATAICKAFGEMTPERKESLKVSLVEKLEQDQIEDAFYKNRWMYQDALEKTIEKVMIKKNNNKEGELQFVFDEYKDLMIKLIMSSASIFAEEQEDADSNIKPVVMTSKSKVGLYKSLVIELKKLDKMLEAKNNG